MEACITSRGSAVVDAVQLWRLETLAAVSGDRMRLARVFAQHPTPSGMHSMLSTHLPRAIVLGSRVAAVQGSRKLDF